MTREMRAVVAEDEAKAPLAIAKAFQHGNLAKCPCAWTGRLVQMDLSDARRPRLGLAAAGRVPPGYAG